MTPGKYLLAGIIGLALVLVLAIPVTYVLARNTPEDQWTCQWERDTLFLQGDRVTIRRCYAWGYLREQNVVRNDEALLFGRCGDRILYLNEEDHFPQGCDWIERTPRLR